MEAFFWLCLLAIAYPYAIYPAALVLINRLGGRRPPALSGHYEPSVSVVLPIHNEATRVVAKIRNLLELDYPLEKLQILVIGDGCTDDSLERAREAGGDSVTTIPLAGRGGKAAALNAGLAAASAEIVVFTDAGIILERPALRRLVAHFENPATGCVSGEDFIEGSQSEGLYGRLELMLRREEALLHSIAGASGCFYAQRRELCEPFRPGMAPDFLSVLNTVRQGKRALAEPAARGSMTATTSQSAEFARKVRTFLRGITALFANAQLLNPVSYPAFSFILWSHKLMRWLAPMPMIGCLVSAYALRAQPTYQLMLVAQLVLYSAAMAGVLLPRIADRIAVVRISAFFLIVNAAALKALGLWLAGTRVEVWQPTQRPK